MKRIIRLEGNIAYVPLTKGYEAVIDADDLQLVETRQWFASMRYRKDGTILRAYAARADYSGGRKRMILMHRLIAGTREGMETDHEDGNGLNNRRYNLREATRSQNMHNRQIDIDNTSGVKGVGWHKRDCKWHARIGLSGKSQHLGYFRCKTAAQFAYAKASRDLHGQFGRVL